MASTPVIAAAGVASTLQTKATDMDVPTGREQHKRRAHDDDDDDDDDGNIKRESMQDDDEVAMDAGPHLWDILVGSGNVHNLNKNMPAPHLTTTASVVDTVQMGAKKSKIQDPTTTATTTTTSRHRVEEQRQLQLAQHDHDVQLATGGFLPRLPLEIVYMLLVNLDLFGLMRLAHTSRHWLRVIGAFFHHTNTRLCNQVLLRTDPWLRSSINTAGLSGDLSMLSPLHEFNDYAFAGSDTHNTEATTPTSNAASPPRPNLFRVFHRLGTTIERHLCALASMQTNITGVIVHPLQDMQHQLLRFDSAVAMTLGTYLTVCNQSQTLVAVRTNVTMRWAACKPTLITTQDRSVEWPMPFHAAVHFINERTIKQREERKFTIDAAQWEDEYRALVHVMNKLDAVNSAFFTTQIACTEVAVSNADYKHYARREVPCCALTPVKMPTHATGTYGAPWLRPSVCGPDGTPSGTCEGKVAPFVSLWEHLDSDTQHYLCRSIHHMRSLWHPLMLGWLLREIGLRNGDTAWCAALVTHAAALGRRYSVTTSGIFPVGSFVRASKLGAAKHFLLHCYYAVNYAVVATEPLGDPIVQVGQLFIGLDAVARLLGHTDADRLMEHDANDTIRSGDESYSHHHHHHHSSSQMEDRVAIGLSTNHTLASALSFFNRLGSDAPSHEGRLQRRMFDNVLQHFMHVYEETLQRQLCSDRHRYDMSLRAAIIRNADTYLHMLMHRRSAAKTAPERLGLAEGVSSNRPVRVKLPEFECVVLIRSMLGTSPPPDHHQQQQQPQSAPALDWPIVAMKKTRDCDLTFVNGTADWSQARTLENAAHLTSIPRLKELFALSTKRANKLSSLPTNVLASLVGSTLCRLFATLMPPSMESDTVQRAFYICDTLLANEMERCFRNATSSVHTTPTEYRDSCFLLLAAILGTPSLFERVYEQVRHHCRLNWSRDFTRTENNVDAYLLLCMGCVSFLQELPILCNTPLAFVDKHTDTNTAQIIPLAGTDTLRRVNRHATPSSSSSSSSSSPVLYDVTRFLSEQIDLSSLHLADVVPHFIWSHCRTRGQYNALSVLAIRTAMSIEPTTADHYAGLLAFLLMHHDVPMNNAFSELTPVAAGRVLRVLNARLQHHPLLDQRGFAVQLVDTHASTAVSMQGLIPWGLDTAMLQYRSCNTRRYRWSITKTQSSSSSAPAADASTTTTTQPSTTECAFSAHWLVPTLNLV